MANHARALIAATSIVLLGVACGSARRGPPQGPLVTLDNPQERAGQVLFYRFCHKCHPGGEAGLGPALNNKPLPGDAIELQVRQGLGAMPEFAPSVISDSQLDAIVAYLDELDG